MKKIYLCLVLSAITSISTFAQESINTTRLDSLLTLYASNGKMMGSFAVSKNGKTIFNKAYGYRQIDSTNKLVADTETKYRIGSITKMFTATMIFQLIQEGKLKLNTPLAKFFPQLQNAKIITIKHLLYHQSGLYNFTNDAEHYSKWYTKPTREKYMLKVFQNHKNVFAPGSKSEYSNTNYLLLGYIIEHVTKNTYANELQKRIVSKVGIKNTYYAGKTDVEKNEAFSFESYIKNEWKRMPETAPSVAHSAGAILSTPTDLNIFIKALFDEKLINKASLAQMTTIVDGYGMGIFQFPFYKKKALGHTGGIDEFHSTLAYFAEDTLAVAFTTNGINCEMNDIMVGILSIVYNRNYTFPNFKTFDIAEQDLPKYEGVYAAKDMPEKLTIKKGKNGLTCQLTGQSSIDMNAKSASEFRVDKVGAILLFVDKKDDKYQAITLKQHGEIIKFFKEK